MRLRWDFSDFIQENRAAVGGFKAAETPLMLYCKEENNFGADKEAGLDAIGRLVERMMAGRSGTGGGGRRKRTMS